jgi:hypothetical protein
LLGGGKDPPEAWERYQLYTKGLEELDASVSKVEHQKILKNDSGEADSLFNVRKANSNFNDTTEAKLLLNKVLVVWKYILHDKFEVSNHPLSSG